MSESIFEKGKRYSIPKKETMFPNAEEIYRQFAKTIMDAKSDTGINESDIMNKFLSTSEILKTLKNFKNSENKEDHLRNKLKRGFEKAKIAVRLAPNHKND